MVNRILGKMGLGRLSDQIRRQLQSEGGFLFVHERVLTTAVLQDFRMPGVFCGLRLMAFVGSTAASDRRFVISASFFNRVWLNLPFDDPRFRRITFAGKGNRLCVSFSANGLIPRASGQVRLRLRVPDATNIVGLMKNKQENIPAK
jgi:hypothetical protein